MATRIPVRDFDYIEARLLAPTPVLEAIERLSELRDLASDNNDDENFNFYAGLIDQLREAAAEFMDECRDVRRKLTDLGRA